VVFPLYPQYAAATTATVYDKLFDTLKTMRDMPAIRTVPPYHDETSYIEALARSIERHLAGLDHEPEVVLASYHGIPQSYFDDGDPYHCHCQKTTRLLRERLGWDKDRLMTTFQSRFGRAEWIKPYTDETVEKLAHDGVRKIAVDQSRLFRRLPGDDGRDRRRSARDLHARRRNGLLAHIACLNDSDDGMALVEELVRRELSGWI
jgi:ferrochelatase